MPRHAAPELALTPTGGLAGAPTGDFARARENMIVGQLTPARLRDARIIDAMRHLPRERFVPPAQSAIAYADRDIPLGGGRVLMEPRIIARLLQILMARRGERALVVGAGSGYGAAVLATLGLEVTALEEDASLLDLARAATADVPTPITFRHAPLAAGLADAAPFPVVLVEGAVELIPPAIAALVAAGGGRLATVLQPPGPAGRAAGRGVLAEHAGAALRSWPHFDAATAVLPGFTIPPAFRF